MKKIFIGIIIFLFVFISFSPNVMAIDCSSGTCYCNADESDCALLRNPRGIYTNEADMAKCGCSDPVQDDLNFCLRTSAIWQFVGYGLLAVKVLVPIIIIIFGLIDFAKAMASGDDKAIKGAASSLIKRLILGVVIFFIPTIVNLVFMVIDNFVGDLSAANSCKACLLNPTSTECNSYKNQAESLREDGGFTSGGTTNGTGAGRYTRD